MAQAQAPTAALHVLVVDDEALARSRLCTLLGDCRAPTAVVVAQAASALEAMALLQTHPVDLVLADIHMPGADGLALARTLRERKVPPALVFVTAHTEHAVDAFELEAVDYLSKPVRLERLQAALQKAQRFLQQRAAPGADEGPVLLIPERHKTHRVAWRDVLYCKAELKYVTVRTVDHSYIWDGSLSEVESRFPGMLMRVHRNAMVAMRAVVALEKQHDSLADGEGWQLRLRGVEEAVAVSRRQLQAVKELLAQ
jgi:two-component system response regulator AlgR